MGSRALEFDSLVDYYPESWCHKRECQIVARSFIRDSFHYGSKTALGQSSPYIRGLTGYHNVLLVDGIRLNHSAMRSGPNQYWSTVELFGSDRVEAITGTHGVLFGADAVGGIVNSLSSEPSYSKQKNYRSFELLGRASSAERSFSAGFSAEVSSPKWFAEISHTERAHLATLMEGKCWETKKYRLRCKRISG